MAPDPDSRRNTGPILMGVLLFALLVGVLSLLRVGITGH